MKCHGHDPLVLWLETEEEEENKAEEDGKAWCYVPLFWLWCYTKKTKKKNNRKRRVRWIMCKACDHLSERETCC